MTRLSLAPQPHEFGIAFVNSDAAADFLRVKLVELKAEASRLSPSNPDVVELDISSTLNGFDGFASHMGLGQTKPKIQISQQDITDFRTAVDNVRATLAASGVSRLRLDEINAFPDLQIADTVGQIVPQVENLLRIYDTTVRGLKPPSRPSAIPIAAGISLGFIVIGAVIYYFVTRQG